MLQGTLSLIVRRNIVTMVHLTKFQCILSQKIVTCSPDHDTCSNCSGFLVMESRQHRRSSVKKTTAVKDKAPLTGCSEDRLIATVQKQRVERKDLEHRLSSSEKEIQSNSIKVNKDLENDILTILADSDLKSSSHIKLF